MQETVFKRNRFSDAAKDLIKFAQNLSNLMNKEKVSCGHLLAAIAHFHPQVIEDLLGVDISDWADKDDVRWGLVKNIDETTPLADELCALLLDHTQETPISYIRRYFPERQLGPAELAFILLKEPTREISDMLVDHNITGDYNALSEMLCFNYLKCSDKHAGISSKEKLEKCIEMGKKFSDYMNQRVIGQKKAVDAVTSALVDFWYRGNDNKPLSLLLLSQNGGGRSFFAQTMQEAFVELGLQDECYSPIDMSGFTHHETADVELLGSDKTYKSSHPGTIWTMNCTNTRGAMVFENIHYGHNTAKRILCSLMQNQAADKHHQKTIYLPFNVLVFTMSLSENNYDFLMKDGEYKLDSQRLCDLLRTKTPADNAQETGGELAVINSAQEIVCLRELEHEDVENIVTDRLAALEIELIEDYGITFAYRGSVIARLLTQSVPHKVTPKELAAIMDKEFHGITKSVLKYSQIDGIEIRCEDLPEYLHDPERRTVRGDYLTFDKCESWDSECKKFIISFEKIKYTTQKSVDCGDFRIERPKNISLDDIVGLDYLKTELQDSLDYISGKYGTSNLPPPALGYILVGAPGTGKSATISALASSCDIPVLFANSAIYSDAKKVDELFVKAKKLAPCIILCDEFGNIGTRTQQPWKAPAIDAILTHMDGVEESGKILVLASANALDNIDPALRRPGRFSRIVHVDLPNAAARDQFIRKFEDKYTFKLEESVRTFLIELADGETIATLKMILEFALRSSVRDGHTIDSVRLKQAYNHAVSRANNAKNHMIGFGAGGNEK